MEIEYSAFYISLSVYVLFLFTSILKRVGGGNSPMANFNRLHLIFSSFYLFFSIYFYSNNNNLSLNTSLHILIGFICYFLLHYSIFLNFFALAQRSISSSILKLLYKNGDITLSDLDKIYASGAGFNHILNSRLEDMERLRWIKAKGKSFILLKSGKNVIRIVSLILNFLGLKQIGHL